MVTLTFTPTVSNPTLKLQFQSPSFQPAGIVTANTQVSPLAPLSLPLLATMTPDANTITVDSSTTHQSILGVGAAISHNAVYCLNNYITPTQLTSILTEMFVTNGWSFIRVAFGSDNSNLPNSAFFTYDDTPNDTTLGNFTLGADLTFTIPVIQQILSINPKVQTLAMICCPPAWTTAGNTLLGSTFANTTTNLTFFANYIVKAIQQYALQGIPINYIAPQNEPSISSASYPTCTWNAAVYANFVNNYLTPAFTAANLTTGIVIGDDTGFASNSWATATIGAGPIATGSQGAAWHAYGGTPNSMTQYTNIPMFMSEWRSLLTDSLAQDQAEMAGMVRDCFADNCGSFILWNIALDQNGAPFLPGNGNRRGVITTDNTTGVITRNPEFNMLTHIGRYTPAGTVRSTCNSFGTGPTPTDVAASSFLQPNGQRAVFLYNGNTTTRNISIYDQQRALGFPLSMNPGDMMTVTWAPH